MTTIEVQARGDFPERGRRKPQRTAPAVEPWELVHQRKVRAIAKRLRERRSDKPLSLRKRTVSHQVPKFGNPKRHDDRLDVSCLDSILKIDVERRICIAEPGVPFDALVRATLRHGLVPCVVPELKTITIGGAVSGCSIESTSFRLGGFHDTCIAYEVITGTGEVLSCTPDNEHALVFQMMQGSFGTLGILSKLVFRLMPAKPFVHVRYETYGTVADYQAAILRHYRERDVDFMDGIIHAEDRLVLCVGSFVERAPYTHRYDWMRVYYKSTLTRTEDYLRTPDYFFRYDRGVTNVHPKSWIGRLLFGKLFTSARLLRMAEKLHFLLPRDRPSVTLDVFLPFSKLPEFLAWHHRELGHYALWCVPYKRVRDYEWLTESFWRGVNDELFVDIAIYGMEQPPGRNAYRMIEEKLHELGGIKTLISHNYYTPEEFWQTWNRETYDAVKRRTDPANVFRDLYTKTCGTAHAR